MKQEIHLKSPGNWINDPNGFIYFQGRYHMFYQHFPYAPQWGTMHWGHAVSDDLVTWEHLPIALFPSMEEDQNGCFSGSAVEKDGKMYLFYTGVHYDKPNPQNIHVPYGDTFDASQIMISSEDGLTFDNFKGKQVVVPTILDEKLGHRVNTRDPKVWKGKDAFYMVLGTMTEDEGGKLLFYKSADLKKWTLVNHVSKNHELGFMWECPDYFEAEGGKVLVFSPMGLIKKENFYDSHAICMQVGFDEETCTMEIPNIYQFLDYGMDLYAPQSTTDELGRRVIVAWARMPKTVDNQWNGMFCMPRLVEVKNGHIYFPLHPNLKKAFNKSLSSPKEASADGYSIHLELHENETISVGGYQIKRENGKLHMDRSKVFADVKGCHTEVETPEIKDGFDVDIYVDANLIEVYINDGEYVVTNVVYGISNEIVTDVVFRMYTK